MVPNERAWWFAKMMLIWIDHLSMYISFSDNVAHKIGGIRLISMEIDINLL